MNAKTKLQLALLLCAGVGVSNVAMASCPGLLTLPTNTSQNSVTFTDAISYSLPILGLDVQSSPGQINDCVVVATGSNGAPITTNFAGMDNAYATPNGTGGPAYFRTGDPTTAPDPGQVSAFVGDTATTWDTRLSALKTALDGNNMVIYFNHNQTNSGSSIDQDLFIWTQIALVDDAGVLPTLYFYAAATSINSPFPNFGNPGGDPTTMSGPQTPATCTYPTGSDSGCTFPKGGVGSDTNATFMVRAIGQICLNGPVGSGTPIPCDGSGGPVIATVNENLGADHVANAIVFPEINAILQTALFGGYDVLQADIRMGCNTATITGGTCVPGSVLNNGFEQIFLGQLAVTPGPPTLVPEPATLALIGIALLGGAFVRRRRIH